MNIRSSLPLHVVVMGLWLFAACTTEEYESGAGEYSYLRADFVEAHSGEAKKVVYATTDEGDSLVFRGGADCSWTTTPDSIYRGLLYSARDGETAPYTHFVSMSPVLVLNVPEKKREKLVTDPLTLESAWVSANGKYLNLGLCVKTGADESDEKKTHLLGVDRDTLFQHVDGRHDDQYDGALLRREVCWLRDGRRTGRRTPRREECGTLGTRTDFRLHQHAGIQRL